jgi:hypothetical protein
MLRHTIIALAAFACAGAAAAQTPAPEPARDCFRNEDIVGWGLLDDHAVRVRINSSRSYAIRTHMNVRRVRWEQSIALTTRSGWICTGDGLGVELHTGGETPRTWIVDSVTRLPENGAATEQAPQQP